MLRRVPERRSSGESKVDLLPGLNELSLLPQRRPGAPRFTVLRWRGGLFGGRGPPLSVAGCEALELFQGSTYGEAPRTLRQ